MPPRRRRATAPIARKQPSQERATATVEAIVTAVERILEKHGAKGLTTNRVAEIAGVSVGTLYQYFPNKESLVGALSERYIQQTLGMCRAALAAGNGVPLATLVDRTAEAMVVATQVQRPIHHWLIELRSAAAYQERYRGAIDEFVAEIAATLEARTDVQLVDPQAAAFVLVHGIEGMISAVSVRMTVIDVSKIAAEAARLVRAYVAAYPPGAVC